VLSRDRVDLLDDDLLEELLRLEDRVRMLRPRHQAAVLEAMEQLVDPIEAVAGGEFPVQDAANIGAAQGADLILGLREGIEPLQESALLVTRQDGPAAGMGALLQRRQAAAVVRGHPGLDGAAATAQAAGDADGGVALLGQDDRLSASPSPGVASLSGHLLQALQGVAILDVHLRNVPIDPCPKVLLWYYEAPSDRERGFLFCSVLPPSSDAIWSIFAMRGGSGFFGSIQPSK
jgi:hypothetical protein